MERGSRIVARGCCGRIQDSQRQEIQIQCYLNGIIDEDRVAQRLSNDSNVLIEGR
jgi:hypothetical protein